MISRICPFLWCVCVWFGMAIFQDKVCLADSTNINFSCLAHHPATMRLCACVKNN